MLTIIAIFEIFIALAFLGFCFSVGSYLGTLFKEYLRNKNR